MNSAVATLRVTSGSRPSCVLWPHRSCSGASRTTRSIRRPGPKPPRNNNAYVSVNGREKPIVVKWSYMKILDQYTDLDIDRRRKYQLRHPDREAERVKRWERTEAG